MLKRSIPIVLDGTETIVKFVPVSPTRFRITIGDVRTNQITDFDDSDAKVDANINEAILVALGDYEWYRL